VAFESDADKDKGDTHSGFAAFNRYGTILRVRTLNAIPDLEEVTRMKWDNVLWDKRVVIFIPDGKTKNARRFVPMSDRVREALRARAQGATSPWVFPSKRSKSGHMSYFLLAKQFSEVREEMGLHPDLVLYSARHTMATDLMGDVKDLSKVGKVLGHSSSAISERYVHPEVMQMTELVNQRNTRRAAEAANSATS
jgi:integrase